MLLSGCFLLFAAPYWFMLPAQPISAAGTAAGLAAAVASGTVGKALDVVDAGIGVAEGAAELTGDGVDAINPIDVKGAVKGNAED